MRRAIALVALCALVVFTAGCAGQARDLVGPYPDSKSASVTSTVEPSASNLVGMWTRVEGDTETVLVLREGGKGSVWSHTTVTKAAGLSAEFPFAYSGLPTVTLAFEDGTTGTFVVKRMSAGALQIEAPAGQEFLHTGLWLRAKK